MSGAAVADLGDGLVLRRGSAADRDRLVSFAREILVKRDGSEDVGVVLWTGDLFDGPPPGFESDLFTLVEDTASGEVVSMLCLIPQTWSYSGIPFGVGRIELVATRSGYRRRGLIRAQMETVHRWSAEMGHLVQVISGIPWFYRRFGYEMALDLGGGRKGRLGAVPEAPEENPWTVRAATAADVPFLSRLYASGMERYLVTCVRDEAMWRHDLEHRTPGSVYHRRLAVVEKDLEPVGMVVYSGPESDTMYVTACEIEPEAGWHDGTQAVLRHLREVAGSEAATIRFGSTTQHPAFVAVQDVLDSALNSYAWFVRVPDLAGFLRRIAPVLEWNLAESPFAGHSATVGINLYTGGIRLRLDGGRLTEIAEFDSDHPEDGDAGFPDLTFLQLVFGRRSTGQLGEARADCWFANDVTAALLDCLFPTGASATHAVG